MHQTVFILFQVLTQIVSKNLKSVKVSTPIFFTGIENIYIGRVTLFGVGNVTINAQMREDKLFRTSNLNKY